MFRTIPLTPHQTELLGVLRAKGDWMSRRAIAHALRREQLHGNDVHALNKMVATGIVEVRSTYHKQGGLRFEYRAIAAAANGVIDDRPDT